MWLFLDKRNELEILFNTSAEFLGYVDAKQLKQFAVRWIPVYVPPEKSEEREKREAPVPLSRFKEK